MSPACPRTLLLALTLLGPVACNSTPAGSSPAPSSSGIAARPLPPPAGPEVVALLDGLAVGNKVGGVPVLAVGAIDARGTIPIVIGQEGEASIIVVAARTETPSPPVNTKSYSVFYETFDARPPVSQQGLAQAMKDVADRLRKTEEKLPVPASLKPLRPGAPA